MACEIITGDCIEEMAKLEACSVDAVVTDPPYGIGFMGHEWDQPGEYGATKANGRPGVHRRGPNRELQKISEGSMEAGRYDLSLTANRRFQAWCEAWARECLRVLKPGGHLLACGGSRTHHRLVSGIEDAGFEIRDRIDCPDGRSVETPDGTLAWYFAQGFPKSADVHKQLSKWAERTCAAWLQAPYDSPVADRKLAELLAVVAELEAPVEEEEWKGWGTALKPAHEPIVVARKPLIGTVAENVLQHGTGGINIDACRIGSGGHLRWSEPRDMGYHGGTNNGSAAVEESPAGRHPANVVLCHLEDCEQVGVRKVRGSGSVTGDEPSAKTDGVLGEFADRAPFQVYADEDGTETVEAWSCAPGCPVAALDEQSGECGSFLPPGRDFEGGVDGNTVYGKKTKNRTWSYGDSGGASRFFYCAKTSRAERNAGLEGFEVKALNWSNGEESPGTFQSEGTDRTATNGHPTVKPLALMRWLVRMVTPPGGRVLDCFAGSGSTGCAAVLEGFDFLGIEREDGSLREDGTRRENYVAIAEARIAFWAQHEGREVEDVLGLVNRSKAAARKHEDNGQGSLLLSTSSVGEEG